MLRDDARHGPPSRHRHHHGVSSLKEWCPSAAEHDSGWGLVLKERRRPELSSQFGRSRIVVLACEVGGQKKKHGQSLIELVGTSPTKIGMLRCCCDGAS